MGILFGLLGMLLAGLALDAVSNDDGEASGQASAQGGGGGGAAMRAETEEITAAMSEGGDGQEEELEFAALDGPLFGDSGLQALYGPQPGTAIGEDAAARELGGAGDDSWASNLFARAEAMLSGEAGDDGSSSEAPLPQPEAVAAPALSANASAAPEDIGLDEPVGPVIAAEEIAGLGDPAEDDVSGPDDGGPIADFVPGEDRILIVYDDAASPEPEVTIETVTADTGGHAAIRLDGQEVARVLLNGSGAGAPGLDDIALVPQSHFA